MAYRKPVGKPLKFKSVAELDMKIALWLSDRTSKELPLTITSLAVYLDTTRETLLDYQKKEKYSDTINRAKALCHCYAEDRLFLSNAAGPTFALKANFGWKDTKNVELTGAGAFSLPVDEYKKLRSEMLDDDDI